MGNNVTNVTTSHSSDNSSHFTIVSIAIATRAYYYYVYSVGRATFCCSPEKNDQAIEPPIRHSVAHACETNKYC